MRFFVIFGLIFLGIVQTTWGQTPSPNKDVDLLNYYLSQEYQNEEQLQYLHSPTLGPVVSLSITAGYHYPLVDLDLGNTQIGIVRVDLGDADVDAGSGGMAGFQLKYNFNRPFFSASLGLAVDYYYYDIGDVDDQLDTNIGIINFSADFGTIHVLSLTPTLELRYPRPWDLGGNAWAVPYMKLGVSVNFHYASEDNVDIDLLGVGGVVGLGVELLVSEHLSFFAEATYRPNTVGLELDLDGGGTVEDARLDSTGVMVSIGMNFYFRADRS